MEPSAPGRFAFLRNRKVLLAAAGVCLAVAAGVAAYALLKVKPEYEVVMLRARTTQDLFTLYDLQMAHHKRHGAYADDLETLLRAAPGGGAALRARLQAHAHLDTLVVAGGADKFKLEANVRDAQRTLIRVKGPRVGDPKPAAR